LLARLFLYPVFYWKTKDDEIARRAMSSTLVLQESLSLFCELFLGFVTILYSFAIADFKRLGTMYRVFFVCRKPSKHSRSGGTRPRSLR